MSTYFDVKMSKIMNSVNLKTKQNTKSRKSRTKINQKRQKTQVLPAAHVVTKAAKNNRLQRESDIIFAAGKFANIHLS